MPRKKKTDSTRLKREILGILMAATGGFMLFALWPYDPALERGPETLNRVGILGSYTAFYLYRALGFGALGLALGLMAAGWLLVFDRLSRKSLALGTSAFAATWLLLTASGLAGVWSGGPSTWAARAGVLGTATAAGLVQIVGLAGALLFCLVAIAVLAVVTFRVSVAETVGAGVEAGRAGGRRAREGFGWLGARFARPGTPDDSLETDSEEVVTAVPVIAVEPRLAVGAA